MSNVRKQRVEHQRDDDASLGMAKNDDSLLLIAEKSLLREPVEKRASILSRVAELERNGGEDRQSAGARSKKDEIYARLVEECTERDRREFLRCDLSSASLVEMREGRSEGLTVRLKNRAREKRDSASLPSFRRREKGFILTLL